MMDHRSNQAAAAVEAAAAAMCQAGWTMTDRGLADPDGRVTVSVRCDADSVEISAFEVYELWPAEDDDPATWTISGPAMPAEMIVSIVSAAAVPRPSGRTWLAVERAMTQAKWRMQTESSHDVLLGATCTSPDGSRELTWSAEGPFTGWFARHAPGAQHWSATEAPEAVLLALTGVSGVR